MPSTVENLIIQTAQRLGVDPRLAVELARAESGFAQSSRGQSGEIGVFQLMPATAQFLGVNPYDLEQNITGGIRYLQLQLNRFRDAAQALAAYNWGPERLAAAASKWGLDWFGHIPSSTQRYVSKILNSVGEWSVSSAPVTAVIQAVRQSAPWQKDLLIALSVFLGLWLLISD